jgi:hypothetical protein
MDFKNFNENLSNFILQLLGIGLLLLIASCCYWMHEDIQIKQLNMRVLLEN